MKVEKKSVHDDREHCNFCHRGERKDNGFGFSYPYESVFQFKVCGSGLVATICEECLIELKDKVNQLL